ncbi:MAG: hypothetical protein K2Q23_10730 [Bryobacteraceae bacterium]|nr:hypothetical protein [Bryobacteraceae bacterium]
MRSILALVLSLALSLFGQLTGVPQPLALIDYLTLTPAQLTTINRNNANFQQMAAEKDLRRAQLQAEISRETDKTPLDPMALGLRYAEVETICRDIRDAQVRLRQDNFAVLTETQRTRMRALEEAMKLVPLANEAEGLNLATFPFSDRGWAIGAILRLEPSGARDTCGVPFLRSIVVPLTSNSRGMSVDHRQDPQQHQK